MIKQNQEISEQTNDAILHGSTILLYQVKNIYISVYLQALL